MRHTFILAALALLAAGCSNTWEGMQRDVDNINKGTVPNTTAAEPNTDVKNY